jgi:Flp pilus assembly protein TadD
LSQIKFRNDEIEEAFSLNNILKKNYPESELAYMNFGAFYYNLGELYQCSQNYLKAVELGQRDDAIIDELKIYFSEQNDTTSLNRLKNALLD